MSLTNSQLVGFFFTDYAHTLGCGMYFSHSWGVMARILWKDGVTVERLKDLTKQLSENKKWNYPKRDLDIALGKRVPQLKIHNVKIPHYNFNTVPNRGLAIGEGWGLGILLRYIFLTDDNFQLYHEFLALPFYSLRRANIQRLALGMKKITFEQMVGSGSSILPFCR
jgi:hypothetical protein